MANQDTLNGILNFPISIIYSDGYVEHVWCSQASDEFANDYAHERGCYESRRYVYMQNFNCLADARSALPEEFKNESDAGLAGRCVTTDAVLQMKLDKIRFGKGE